MAKDYTSFFGHPKSLATLFGVEMWERFSFYGVQAILVFYVTYQGVQGGLGLDKGTATSLAGAYGGMVFLSTILFGWISDRILGREKTLFYSAIIVVLGHLSMALLHGVVGLVVGLLLIAFGGGGVKASSTSMVGTLYDNNDPRSDAGFSLYYFGINVGAFLGSLVTGALQGVGFHYAFGAAAIGMALGLAQYTVGRKVFAEETRKPSDPLTPEEASRAKTITAVAIVVIVLLGWFTFSSPSRAAFAGENVSTFIAIFSAVAAIAIISMLLRTDKTTVEEKSRIIAFIPLLVSQVAFWALYQQIFTFLPLFTDERLNRKIFGWEFPTAWMNSVSAIYVMLLALVFAGVWTKLGDKNPSTPVKFAFANFLIGVAYLLFLPVANSGQNKVPLLLVLFILLLFCVAELCISPIGLSVATRLSPKRFVTMMVALYMLASSMGTALSGTIAGYYNPTNEVPYFVGVGLTSIVVSGIIAGLVPFIKKKMAGIR
ncbi:MAG: oligopeptide:H+ symporter [Micrococcaceae bacterium]